MSVVREVNVGDRTIKLEFQKFAKQANGSVMVSCGNTSVLVTVCGTSEPREGQSFFPLTVDYIEKFYAVGRIPGGFIKRETKPSELETLTARVIDRPLRPCFPEGYMNDVHVVATVVSLDESVQPAPLAMLGASTALMISDIPFNGPVAGLRLGRRDGEFFLDPDYSSETDLDLTIACKPDAVLMVEAAANFLSEDEMLAAINHAHDLMKPLFDMQYDIQKEIGKQKIDVIETSYHEDTLVKVNELGRPKIVQALQVNDKIERYKTLALVKKELKAEINPDNDAEIAAAISHGFEEAKYNVMREQILKEKRRIGGRGYSDIRQITCEPGLLPRPHGSALFTRGETQALATVTLGAAEDEQRVDTISTPNQTQRFMLHYNFPPFSVGEARPLRAPGRREIGHGYLAHKALTPVIPEKSEFGYTIRICSEILESNGSSSMATVCSGTLAMLDAGVPLKEPVAGIAMGLIKEGDDYAILSDILGDEDHLGDMDFKVCGGASGITALQMDIKIAGLSKDIMSEALSQAKEGRQHILDKMNEIISEPSELSETAPRIFHMKVPQDKIRGIIGPGGKTIKKIVADTGVKIDIDDDGMVHIVSPDVASAEEAKKFIRSVTTDPEVGGLYLGNVKRVVDFGAFIEISPGTEGLCHISELENKRVNKVTDVLNEGDEVMVKILDIDRQGKIKLSRKAALDQKPPQE